MPKHKSAETVESDSTSDSGPDDREPVVKKQKKEKEKKKVKSSSGDDQEHSFPLSKQKFLNVREFKGRLLIDIREFYDAGGELKPGKKGISLTVDQWRKLESQMDEINESIQALS